MIQFYLKAINQFIDYAKKNLTAKEVRKNPGVPRSITQVGFQIDIQS